MIITITGLPGSGKTSVGKILAKKLHIKFFSIGNMVREYAKKNNILLMEMEKQIKNNKSMNIKIDNEQKKLVNKYKNFIIDSRIGAAIFKKAGYRIYLHASLKKRAERIAKREKKSFKQALHETRIRERDELQQYRKHYNIDYRNRRYYNIILNTENLTPLLTANKLIAIIKNNKTFKR